MDGARGQLSRFAAIFAGGTLISRVLGLARDVVLGALLPTASRDLFFFAFKIPNMLRDLVGEGAMNAAFVPTFARSLESGDREGFRELVRSAMSAMAIVLGVLTAMGVILAPVLLGGMRTLSGFTGGERVTPEEIEQLVRATRWTFPYLFFIGMAVFAMGPLFTLKRYTTSSWSPALLNVALIACCVGMRGWFAEPAYALVAGVWIGGVAQLAAQFIALGRHSGVWLPGRRLRHPGVWAIFVLMMPVIVGQAAGEVNKLVDVLFARSLGEGVVNAFFYANRLIQLPLSIFGFAVAAAILPALSQSASRKAHEEIRGTLRHGFRQCYFLVLPSLLGLLVLGEPIVKVLFERGHWTPLDTQYTTNALRVYALGLLSFAWVKVGVTGFYCMNDTKTPVVVASLSMLLNIALNVALVRPMGYLGLALATSVAYTVNFVALYRLLGKRYGALCDGPLLTGLLRMSVAGVLMAAVTLVGHMAVRAWLPGEGFPARATALGAALALAGTVYLGVCAALGVEEVGMIGRLLRRKTRGA